MPQRQNYFHERINQFRRVGFFLRLDRHRLFKYPDYLRHFQINVAHAQDYIAVDCHGQNFSRDKSSVIVADFLCQLEHVSYRKRGVEVVFHCRIKIRKQPLAFFDKPARLTYRYCKIFLARVLDELARMNQPRQIV